MRWPRLIGTVNDPVTERGQRGHVQVITGVCERSVQGAALSAGAAANPGEKVIERGLVRKFGHRQPRADPRRLRQFAAAREGFERIVSPSTSPAQRLRLAPPKLFSVARRHHQAACHWLVQ